MRYKLLGKNGLRVSELCLGTMTFDEDWGWGASQDESRKVFDAFVEAGGNFIDTANGYTDGSSKYNKSQGNGNEQGRLSSTAGGNISERALAIAEVVTQVAQEIGRTPSQVALAWLRAQAGVIIPIIGALKVSQIQDNLACVDIDLSPEHLQRLNEVSKIELGFPHDFLQNDVIRDRLFGGTFNLIDNHHS
ncbi:hypothetical protein CEN40_25635 [Fischerella thermalis CCMEE 5205]|nr:hypothetical protein CEN40_25635 [Fischerella thermalis CCMEE 5205]